MSSPLPQTLWQTLKHYFDALPDKAYEAETIDQISSGVTFRGTNLWVLIFAILIASLGLNVNSTAVIIGAMLISPLMGPIIGMGLAIGIGDLSLLKNSIKNYLIATVISVLTAMLYFSISPLTEAQSELLARTSPTLYDVLIALFGGAAGILALSTRGKGNVLPATDLPRENGRFSSELSICFSSTPSSLPSPLTLECECSVFVPKQRLVRSA